MDRKYKFGALAIVAMLPLLLAAQGGFPSRPRFQSVDVVGTVTAGNFAGNLSASSINAGTLAVARGGTGTSTSTGTGSVVLSASPTFTGTITAATLNASSALQVAGVNVCRSNGINCPVGRIQGGSVNSTASCGTAGGYNPLNSTAKNGTGDCTINWNTAYSSGPLCTASMGSNAAGSVAIVSTTSTSVRIQIYNAAGAAVEGQANVHCFGL